MKKKIILIFIAVIIVLGAAGFWYVSTSGIIGDLYATKGMDLVYEGKYQEAIPFLEKSVTRDTSFELGDVYDALGECYSGIGNSDKSIEMYMKAIQEDNTSIIHMLNLSVEYITINDLESAEEWLNKAKQTDPGDNRLRTTFGGLYIKKNEPEKALTALEASLEVEPDPYCFALASEASAMLGDFDQSQEYFKQAEQSGLDQELAELYRIKINKYKKQQ